MTRSQPHPTLIAARTPDPAANLATYTGVRLASGKPHPGVEQQRRATTSPRPVHAHPDRQPRRKRATPVAAAIFRTQRIGARIIPVTSEMTRAAP